jgi:peroxiredoxin
MISESKRRLMDSIADIKPAEPPAPRLGLAIASLILGIIACILTLFLVGALFGIVGLILGILHVLKRRGPNGMAWCGIGLSLFSIPASVALGFVYYRAMSEMTRDSFSGGGSEWEGVAAPDISMKTIDGKIIRLSELRGKRVILDFWATWCGPCVEEIPHFNRLYNETSRDDLVIIGISKEDPETVRSFAVKKGMHYALAGAEHWPSPYKDVRGIPTTFFIDRNGVMQSALIGSHGFDALKAKALAQDFKGEPRAAPGEQPSGLDQRKGGSINKQGGK